MNRKSIKAKKNIVIINSVIGILSVVSMFIMTLVFNSIFLTIISAVVLLVTIAVRLYVWRCPDCGVSLDKSNSPGECSNCGTKLYDSE